jgi:hypothetical protein
MAAGALLEATTTRLIASANVLFIFTQYAAQRFFSIAIRNTIKGYVVTLYGKIRAQRIFRVAVWLIILLCTREVRHYLPVFECPSSIVWSREGRVSLLNTLIPLATSLLLHEGSWRRFLHKMTRGRTATTGVLISKAIYVILT